MYEHPGGPRPPAADAHGHFRPLFAVFRSFFPLPPLPPLEEANSAFSVFFANFWTFFVALENFLPMPLPMGAGRATASPSKKMLGKFD